MPQMMFNTDALRKRLAAAGPAARLYLGAPHAVLLALRGDRARNRGNWRTAAASYGAAVAIRPDLVHIWVQYGHALKESGDRGRAETAYRRAIAGGLDNADIHLQIGHVLKLDGRLIEAAEAYGAAFLRDPADPGVMRELSELGWTRADFRAALDRHGSPYVAPTIARKQSRSLLMFDISDLIHFVLVAERPTGIQRVQLQVIGALLEQDQTDPPRLIAFSRAANSWIDIDVDLFNTIAELTRTQHARDDRAWRDVRRRIMLTLVASDDADLTARGVLLNLGSSWAFGNYFMAVRKAKLERNIVYIPFLHDCIPILFPQWFVPELQRDFREWLGGVYRHADAILANSHATANDVRRLAPALGAALSSRIDVVPLDAVFETSHRGDSRSAAAAVSAILARHDLIDREFVLFVSTIEPRKNHKLIFETWCRLLKSRGADRMPPLVCVGGRGWRNAATLAVLDQSPDVMKKIKLIHGVADGELDALYRSCRFTVYPSQYEGWGLPITEALSRGRAVLAARSSSLPEAGGAFADYFALDDKSGLETALCRLIDDDAYLQRREASIRSAFKPRSWSEIADDIVQRAASVQAAPQQLPTVPLSTFVRLGKDPAGPQPSGVELGERFRSGAGWAEADDHGSQLTGAAPAQLTFVLPRRDAPGPFRLHILAYGAAIPRAMELSGDRNDDGRQHVLQLTVATGARARFRIWADQERWLRIDLDGSTTAETNASVDLSVVDTLGHPRQVSAVGIAALFLVAPGDSAAEQTFLEGVALGASRERISGLPDGLDTLATGAIANGADVGDLEDRISAPSRHGANP